MKIPNEDEAWELLKQALAGEREVDLDNEILHFAGWPYFTVSLPQTPVASSMNATTMQAFIDLQDTIYRAHTAVDNETPDLRTLTNTDRERLEFHVKVSGGSSNYFADLSSALQKIGIEAIGKMTPQQVTITIITIALVVGSATVFKWWMGDRADKREKDAATNAAKNATDAVIRAQEIAFTAESERTKLLVEALARSPEARAVEDAMDGTRSRVLRALANDGGGSTQGIDLDAETARQIAVSPRRKSEVQTVSGSYRVVNVNSSSPDGFRVTLQDTATDEQIIASLRDAILSERDKATFINAEWNRQEVFVTLSSRVIDGRSVDAVVESARPIEGAEQADG